MAWSCRDSLTGRCAHEPLHVYGDGEQTRCFTNVRDVVRALVALVDAPLAVGEIVNIGQPNQIRIVDLARRIVELAESPSEIKLVPYDADEAYGARAAGYEDMRRRVPDTTKLHALTGFVPQIGLDQTLREVIDYYLAEVCRARANRQVVGGCAASAASSPSASSGSRNTICARWPRRSRTAALTRTASTWRLTARSGSGSAA